MRLEGYPQLRGGTGAALPTPDPHSSALPSFLATHNRYPFMASDTTALPALPSDEALLASLTDLHGQQPRLKHRDDGFLSDLSGRLGMGSAEMR